MAFNEIFYVKWSRQLIPILEFYFQKLFEWSRTLDKWTIFDFFKNIAWRQKLQTLVKMGGNSMILFGEFPKCNLGKRESYFVAMQSEQNILIIKLLCKSKNQNFFEETRYSFRKCTLQWVILDFSIEYISSIGTCVNEQKFFWV